MVVNQHIYVNTAVVIFSIVAGELKVLLIKRTQAPFEGFWGLPGGYIDDNKSADDTVMEKLLVKTGLKHMYLEQFGVFSNPKRDPRYRAISLGYMSIGTFTDIKKYSQYGEVAFHGIKTMAKLAFDHREIMTQAYMVLRHKLFHTNIAQFFLPRYFTLQQLQEVYDIILGTTSDVRNFRKYIEKAHIIKSTGKKETNVSHRPAVLYEFLYKDIKISDYNW